jgi:hypothetical protein
MCEWPTQKNSMAGVSGKIVVDLRTVFPVRPIPAIRQ